MSLLLALQGPVEVTISGAVLEGSDSVAGTVGLVVSINGAILEGSDAVAGTVAAVHSISGAVTEGSDAVAGTVDLLVVVSGDVLEGSNAVAGTIEVEAIAEGDGDLGAKLRKAAREQRYIYRRVEDAPLPVPVFKAIERVVERYEEQEPPEIGEAAALLARELYRDGLPSLQGYADILYDELARLERERLSGEDDGVMAAIAALL